MSKYVKIGFEQTVTVIVLIFGAFLLWQLLVGNHRANIARDQYLIDHCKVVEEAKYSFEEGLQCKQ